MSRAWKVCRHLGEPVTRIDQLVRGLCTGGVCREHEETVVRPDERPAVARAHRHRAAIAADTGVDDREMDADRQVRERVAQHDRSLEHRLRLDAVRHVDHPHLGGDLCDHSVARPDEVVLQPEVGEEGDHAHGSESITSRTAATRPSRSWVAASAGYLEPDRAARPATSPGRS